MNRGDPSAWRAVGLTGLHQASRDLPVARRSPSRMTRRQFARSVAGTAVFGGALGAGLLKPGIAKERESFTPVPIPGGTPVLNGAYHFFAPNLIDPIDAEPITITNMNGFVGLAYISRMVTQTNTQTGETLRLPFLNSDMRFMQGVFRGADGEVHRGSFALV